MIVVEAFASEPHASLPRDKISNSQYCLPAGMPVDGNDAGRTQRVNRAPEAGVADSNDENPPTGGTPGATHCRFDKADARCTVEEAIHDQSEDVVPFGEVPGNSKREAERPLAALSATVVICRQTVAAKDENDESG